MSQTGIAAFDTTIHATNAWLNDVAEEMQWEDRQKAYHALRAVLHALRDHMPPTAVAKLGAQLPMLVRGIYYEGWHPSDKPLKGRKEEDFLGPLRREFRGEPEAVEAIARGVFRAIARNVSSGEIDNVKHALPHAIREYWE